jgi:hypothetical protein
LDAYNCKICNLGYVTSKFVNAVMLMQVGYCVNLTKP